MKSRKFESPPREIVVIAHNIRSVLNIGAILRTAEGFGVERVFASGYTANLEYTYAFHSEPNLSSRAQPRNLISESSYEKGTSPATNSTWIPPDQSPGQACQARNDSVAYQKILPHVRDKLQKELHKTALGAEEIVDFRFAPNVLELIRKLRDDGFRIVGLEQDARAISLPGYKPPEKIALLLGEEVHGLTPELRELCDDLIEIPMFGRKESFNVSVATGIALYGFLRQ